MAVSVSKSKHPKYSPTFEKLNQERLQQCAKTTEAARQTVETSRELTKRAEELITAMRTRSKRRALKA